jgi:hypothetical protein
MSTISTQLQITLQDLDDNPDTWGDILNTSTIQLLEDAIAQMSSVVLLSAVDYTMDTTAGGETSGNGHYRDMIVNITGTPGGATNVLCPDDTSLGVSSTGIYLVYDGTTGGDTITFKTVNGTGVALIAGRATWLYCDGTNIVGANALTSETSDSCVLAADSTLLGGVAAADYALTGASQTYTAGQGVARVTLVDNLGDITPDLDVSNTFYHELLQAENLATPTNPSDGDMFSLVAVQGVGAPWGLTFQSGTFIWAGGVAPTLSTGVGDVDLLAFEYVTGLPAPISGARWIGSIIKDAF